MFGTLIRRKPPAASNGSLPAAPPLMREATSKYSRSLSEK